MPTESLKQTLTRNGASVGTMVFEFLVPGLPAIVAATGADFILYDMEHSGAGLETLKTQVAACRGLPVAPLVRVPTNQYHFVARALDVGVQGVMVPMVGTREQAEEIVSWAHYPPRGRRGAAFSVAHDGYTGGNPIDKIREAGERTLLIAQIETAEGLRNVDEIAAVPGIDVVWVGHFDLTNFMGIPCQFDHPDYVKGLESVVAAAQRHGKIAGFMASDERWAREYWDRGFRMIAYGLDHLVYQRALGDGIADLRRHAAGG